MGTWVSRLGTSDCIWGRLVSNLERLENNWERKASISENLGNTTATMVSSFGLTPEYNLGMRGSKRVKKENMMGMKDCS